MSTERDRMLAGELYDPFDAERAAGRTRARDFAAGNPCQVIRAVEG